MVKLILVIDPAIAPESKRIGVFEAFKKGFELIAAQPALILPPLLLDLFLWMGPRLKLTSLVEGISNAMLSLLGTEETLNEQIALFREIAVEVALRLNLLASLSSRPIGIPSLMSSRLPLESPLGAPQVFQLIDPSLVVFWGLIFYLMGLGMGAGYHLVLARKVGLAQETGNFRSAWWRLMLMTLALYLVLIVGSMVIILVATLVGFLAQWLSGLVIFMGYSLLFWLLLYLFFTPYGMIRFDLGLLRAMLESAMLVRWNMLGAVTFLGGAYMISWLTNRVWFMTDEGSWIALLGLLGHAFISSMLIAATYSFYQGRRAWMIEFQQVLAQRAQQAQPRT